MRVWLTSIMCTYILCMPDFKLAGRHIDLFALHALQMVVWAGTEP